MLPPQTAGGATPPPSTSPCIVCRNQIPVGALKCTECDSFQNWRRYLEFSSLALSLLVALISVSGIVIPALVKSLDPPRSKVQGALILMHPIEVHPLRAYEIGKLRYKVPLDILITNSGDRTALLTDFSVSLSGAGQPLDKSFLPLKLEPGAFKPVRIVVELKPSDSLPQDWNLSEVRHSDMIKATVELGGSIRLDLLNSQAAHETIRLDLPTQNNAIVVPNTNIFKNWRLRS